MKMEAAIHCLQYQITNKDEQRGVWYGLIRIIESHCL